jgi:deoxyribodipyrimidine photo-lyase
MTAIHWFRRDLRLSDNLALNAASQSGENNILLFIFDPTIYHGRHSSAPRMAFMLKALTALEEALEKHGSHLIIRHGNPRQILPEFIRETGASALYFNRDYTPFARKRDAAIVESCGIQSYSFDDGLLLAPGQVVKADGNPFTVFTPFKKQWLLQPKADSVAPQNHFHDVENIPQQGLPTLADLGFNRTIDVPEASELAAQKRLNTFLTHQVYDYSTGRDRLPASSDDDTLGGSSFLSPYLRFGLISPRQVYWAAREAYQQRHNYEAQSSVETWVSELVWREFYMHILYYFPHAAKGNYRRQYDALEWRHAPNELQAWKDGQTGYPIVDAAMRQLKSMGWMPNRARMIVASFLTKDLLIDWREGEKHFMNWLIDGDPAANNGGWQWTAGTGTDAQPYFRIFNPVSQSQKFDPDGIYIRRWVPELRGVPTKYIHAPWEMENPPDLYPPPIVDHAFARERTLAAFNAIKDWS